ncbi:hypothetical protein BV25DRAFT_1839460 [Artomyces pyxidatus]|uniref:Uncharacterized protein n=1 Tax=Artomyces pyxidatus TaxID=48021 RepID=A0ACB8SXU2_9AGAM|nr:hypothetical protein BV25DRAFT_1839460 [Artomyces pyxidatus]
MSTQSSRQPASTSCTRKVSEAPSLRNFKSLHQEVSEVSRAPVAAESRNGGDEDAAFSGVQVPPPGTKERSSTTESLASRWGIGNVEDRGLPEGARMTRRSYAAAVSQAALVTPRPVRQYREQEGPKSKIPVRQMEPTTVPPRSHQGVKMGSTVDTVIHRVRLRHYADKAARNTKARIHSSHATVKASKAAALIEAEGVLAKITKTAVIQSNKVDCLDVSRLVKQAKYAFDIPWSSMIDLPDQLGRIPPAWLRPEAKVKIETVESDTGSNYLSDNTSETGDVGREGPPVAPGAMLVPCGGQIHPARGSIRRTDPSVAPIHPGRSKSTALMGIEPRHIERTSFPILFVPPNTAPCHVLQGWIHGAGWIRAPDPSCSNMASLVELIWGRGTARVVPRSSVGDGESQMALQKLSELHSSHQKRPKLDYDAFPDRWIWNAKRRVSRSMHTMIDTKGDDEHGVEDEHTRLQCTDDTTSPSGLPERFALRVGGMEGSRCSNGEWWRVDTFDHKIQIQSKGMMTTGSKTSTSECWSDGSREGVAEGHDRVAEAARPAFIAHLLSVGAFGFGKCMDRSLSSSHNSQYFHLGVQRISSTYLHSDFATATPSLLTDLGLPRLIAIAGTGPCAAPPMNTCPACQPAEAVSTPHLVDSLGIHCIAAGNGIGRAPKVGCLASAADVHAARLARQSNVNDGVAANMELRTASHARGEDGPYASLAIIGDASSPTNPSASSHRHPAPVHIVELSLLLPNFCQPLRLVVASTTRPPTPATPTRRNEVLPAILRDRSEIEISRLALE